MRPTVVAFRGLTPPSRRGPYRIESDAMTLEVLRTPTALPPGTAVCIGAFDGLHRGHRALIETARALGEHVAVVTFDPHPSRVLQPDRAPKLLQTPVQRERVLAALRVDKLVLLPFNRDIAALSPEDFARHTFIEGLQPRAVVVGADFRFGHKRTGDAASLRELLAPHGIEVEIVPPVLSTDGNDPALHKLSSSEIRHCISAGQLEAATRMLGRHHTVAGHVVTGDRRGRTIGFPTANIACEGAFLPPLGVYATYLIMWDPTHEDHGTVWPSAANLGRNPTFGDGTLPRLEVHVLDRDLGERLYGAQVEVAFVSRLRDELRFDSVDELIAQMHRDVAEVRARLAAAPRDAILAPGDSMNGLS